MSGTPSTVKALLRRRNGFWDGGVGHGLNHTIEQFRYSGVITCVAGGLIICVLLFRMKYDIPPVYPRDPTVPTHFWFSPLFNTAAWDIPVQPRGGFLAEEMGLGKTVEVLALILSNPAPAEPEAGQMIANTYRASGAEKHTAGADANLIVSKGTLVVCPVSLVSG